MDKGKLNVFNKKRLPINLLKKEQRERRQRNELPLKRKKRKRKCSNQKSFEIIEHEALVKKTDAELKKLLQNDEILSDIPADCTPEEIEAEIALAEGNATTIYVERDDLPTLTIVLPQEQPTLANLKRAIERTSRIQLTRHLRERFEERLQRRLRGLPSTMVETLENRGRENPAKENLSSERQSLADNARLVGLLEDDRKAATSCTGEFVCSTAFNGHPHRSNVSWRFLWRAYMLFHIEMNRPIFDSDGRKLLSELGIENTTTLKFCKREKYCGRKRQR